MTRNVVKRLVAREFPGRLDGALRMVRVRLRGHDGSALSTRTAFVAALADALRPLAETASVKAEATRLLGEHLAASRVFYAEIEPDGEHFLVDQGFTTDLPSFEGRHKVAELGSTVAVELAAGRTIVVGAASLDARLSGQERRAWEASKVRAAVGVPLVKDGRWVAVLGVHQVVARAWTSEEISLVEETAERTWGAVERARAERALRESEERFRLAATNQALTLFEQDRALRYVWVYPQHPEFPDANIGRTDAELVPGEAGEGLMDLKRQVLETGEELRAEFEVPLPSGTRWYDIIIEPRLDGTEVVGVAGAALDVTERHRAAELLRDSERQYETLVRTAFDIVWETDAEGVVDTDSPSWREFTGQSASEWLGGGWLAAVHPGDRDRVSAAWQKHVQAREPIEIDYRIRHHSGEWRWMTTHAVPVVRAGGAVYRWIGISSDETERKQAEELREAFVAVLSHELRTPVTIILGMADLLAGRTSDGARDERAELAGEISAEAGRLDRLVEDLLVLSRAEKGQLGVTPEPVLIQHEILAAITAEARRFPHVTFIPESPPLPPAAAERSYVLQILRNLLSNAAKYGPDGPCEVRVVAEEDGTSIVVQVLDEGPGFAPEDEEHLFELFYRSASMVRRGGGAGIGLYVTRALVEAMGGRVWAVPREGGGSEFGFTLPLHPDDEEDRERTPVLLSGPPGWEASDERRSDPSQEPGPRPKPLLAASFPSEDAAFSRVIGALLARIAPGSPEQLEAALRRTHPLAVVRRRQLSAEPWDIWYVYRDGAALARWATGTWWEAPGISRVRLDAQGVFTEANEAADEIMGAAPGSLIGRSFREVALAGDAEGIELMWRALAELGQIDSVYTISDAKGQPITLEVHAEVVDGGVLVYSRPILLAAS